jgi:pimeloyl-ACP methyl ester carboxylesterase
LLARGFQRTVHVIHRPLRPPAGMMIGDLAGWHATALRDRFGAPVDVMGVSGGGVTGLQLALDHPQAVRRLVLCVAGSRVSGDGVRDLLAQVRLEAGGRSAAAALAGRRLMAHGPLRLLFLALYALAPGARGRPERSRSRWRGSTGT